MEARPRRVAAWAMTAGLLLAGCSSGAASPEIRRIAILRAFPAVTDQAPFYEELRRAGFERGRNLRVLSDPDDTHPDRDDAAQAVEAWQEAGVDLVVAYSTTGAEVVRDTAPELKALFLSNDPQATGLVVDEEQPGGRLTGVTFRVPADRTLDLAERALPSLDRVGLLYPPADPAALPHRAAVIAAGRDLRIEVVTARMETSGEDVPDAVDRLVDDGVDALFVSNSPTALRSVDAIAEAASAHDLPMIANTLVADRAVLVLSPDIGEIQRQLGLQAVRLLSGAPVSDVPVEDPHHFEVVLDAGVAADLGFEIPEDVMRRADEVRR